MWKYIYIDIRYGYWIWIKKYMDIIDIRYGYIYYALYIYV